MAKKISKNNKIIGSFDENMKGILITVLCILCFFGAFYLLTVYVTNKNTKAADEEQTTDTSSDPTISYDEIMIGRSFSMSDGEYFVLYYDRSDEKINSTYTDLVNTYKAKNDHLDIYKVDMSNSFNKDYATVGEANKSPSTEADILINGPTLIKVSNNKVVQYVEGEEEITKHLK